MKIKLADGTEINNLVLNGNNYISDEVISDEIFENNLETVTISDGDNIEYHTNMKLVANRRMNDGKSWFILAEKTEQEIKDEQADLFNMALLDKITALVLEKGI